MPLFKRPWTQRTSKQSITWLKRHGNQHLGRFQGSKTLRRIATPPMQDNAEWSLIPQPSRSLAREGSAGRRIVEEMVSGTLDVMQAQSSALVPRFAIGEHLLCEPDYHQILMWAKELRIPQQQVLDSILKDPFLQNPYTQWNKTFSTRIENGRLKSLAWDTSLLPISNFSISPEIEIQSLVFACDRGAATRHSSPCTVAAFPSYLSLDLPALITLDCSWLGLENVEVDKSKKLTDLQCYNNQLTLLSLDALPDLRRLTCFGNDLGDLRISTCPSLHQLNCSRNKRLADLNLSGVPNLRSLNCGESRIDHIDLLHLPLLEFLACHHCNVQTLDLSNTPNLSQLWCWHNKISELRLECVPNLVDLQCQGNDLEQIDIRPLKHLKTLKYDAGKTRLIQRPDQNF